MKKTMFLLIFLSIAICLFQCNSNQETEQSEKTGQIEEHAKLNITADMLTTDKDLACGMTLTSSTIADTAIYQGQLYGFCCDHCKAKFKENPQELISQMDSQK